MLFLLSSIPNFYWPCPSCKCVSHNSDCWQHLAGVLLSLLCRQTWHVDIQEDTFASWMTACLCVIGVCYVLFSELTFDCSKKFITFPVQAIRVRLSFISPPNGEKVPVGCVVFCAHLISGQLCFPTLCLYCEYIEFTLWLANGMHHWVTSTAFHIVDKFMVTW